jgi:DNA (cytosine-5)-methyltransferase 1
MSLRFIDLCAGLGGFHNALSSFGFECVFASEINEELRENYKKNFPGSSSITYGDIRVSKSLVPRHDILCAGFPCQPFSKSGYQKGFEDETGGTIFHEVLEILKKHKPSYVLLENVGNFERHDSGRTWQIVKSHLEHLGYSVRGTTHVSSGGAGLLSPHHLGFPHHRERFFIVGSLNHELPEEPFPKRKSKPLISLENYIKSYQELSELEKCETKISQRQNDCIDHWNKLWLNLPEEKVLLPSFPLWGDEIESTYPFEKYTPHATTVKELRENLSKFSLKNKMRKDELMALLPSYARTPEKEFPQWKINFIKQNRAWFSKYSNFLSREWIDTLNEFPPSLRKLEWNCHGEERDLWKYILQFRPSGLRVKRYTYIPSLVAMTETQIPILGPKKRFLSRTEGLLLLGFQDSHILPIRRERAFSALGNGVHVEVVKSIIETVLPDKQGMQDKSSKNTIGSVFFGLNNHEFAS